MMERAARSGLVLFAAVMTAAAPLWAQGVAAVPVFEVVSVRPAQQPCASGSGLLPSPNGLHIACLPLEILIAQAYGLALDVNRLTGAPAWAKSAMYDVEAKVADEDVERYGKLTVEQQHEMLRAILADRFHLQAHKEMKEFPVYALVIAKGGSKLKESTADEGLPMVRRRGRGQIESKAASLVSLPLFLQQEVGRPIVDETGLTGMYDFTLRWTPEQGPKPSADATTSDEAPGLFTAIQEQLGLKLEPAKTPLETIVIDHIERPSGN
jgi:uncharacterized protein (TIGR03435 family)